MYIFHALVPAAETGSVKSKFQVKHDKETGRMDWTAALPGSGATPLMPDFKWAKKKAQRAPDHEENTARLRKRYLLCYLTCVDQSLDVEQGQLVVIRLANGAA